MQRTRRNNQLEKLACEWCLCRGMMARSSERPTSLRSFKEWPMEGDSAFILSIAVNLKRGEMLRDMFEYLSMFLGAGFDDLHLGDDAHALDEDDELDGLEYLEDAI
jgi:hypothetical protein